MSKQAKTAQELLEQCRQREAEGRYDNPTGFTEEQKRENYANWVKLTTSAQAMQGRAQQPLVDQTQPRRVRDLY